MHVEWRSGRPGRRLPRVGLRARLVLTVVLLAVAVVVLDTVLTRWAFQNRFLSYVQNQETEVLERLGERLAEVHARDGGWDRVDLRRELRGLHAHEDRGAARTQRGQASEEQASTKGLTSGGSHSGESMDAGNRANYRMLRSMLPRLQLTSAEGRILFGPADGLPAGARIAEQPIEAGSGTIGTLRLVSAREISRDRDRRFADDLLRLIGWIAVAAAGLAALVGWWLAHRLLAPIRAVTRGARQLAAGRYDVRLDVDRGDELGALAADFNQLASALEASRDARQRWLADVAHELRTPVAVLRAEIEALGDGVRPLDGAAVASLASEVARLTRLIDDLHQLSLADEGALTYRFRRLDLAAIVRDAVDRFATRFEEAGLALTLALPADPLPCEADPDRFEQLLANLLENTLRYTDAPGQVRLALSGTPAGLVLTLEDGPPGVPVADLERLFERFARLDASRSREFGGAGLGLAIARRIVAAHGGRIAAAASSLGGLAIRVELPGADARTRPAATGESAP